MKVTLASLFSVGQNSKSVDLSLLLLRLMMMPCLIYHHGIDKITDWNLLTTNPLMRMDPFGIGVVASMLIAGFADLFCAFLVLIGFATRIASFICIGVLGTVVFILAHALTSPLFPMVHGGHGELSWVYMAGFVVIIIVGPGRYSLDSKLAAWFGRKSAN